MSLVAIGSALLRQRRPFFGLTLAVPLLLILVAFIAHRTWTSTIVFLPQTSTSALSRLGGIAAEFGLSDIGTGSSYSPDFYTDVVRSRQLLGAVVGDRYLLPGARSDSGTLVEYFGSTGATPQVRMGRAIDRLSHAVSASASARSGLVTVTVSLKHPHLALAVADRILAELHSFNVRTQQEQAREERVYIEARLRHVHEQLRAAEDAVQTFLERNRQWQDSPALQFEYQRLQRELTFRQQIYSALAQSYEQTRLDELRDTPVITMVQLPTLPVRPDRRRLLVKGVVGLLLGAMLGTVVALARDAADRLRHAGDREYEAYRMLVRDSLAGLKFWRRGSARGDAR